MEIDSDSILSRVPPPGAVPVSLSEGIWSKLAKIFMLLHK